MKVIRIFFKLQNFQLFEWLWPTEIKSMKCYNKRWTSDIQQQRYIYKDGACFVKVGQDMVFILSKSPKTCIWFYYFVKVTQDTVFILSKSFIPLSKCTSPQRKIMYLKIFKWQLGITTPTLTTNQYPSYFSYQLLYFL